MCGGRIDFIKQRREQTFEVGSEAVDIISFLLFVTHPISPDAGGGVFSSAGFSGFGDGVLNGSVTEPAGVTPVQTISPGVVQLLKRRHDSILLSASFFSIVEVQAVATQTRKIRKQDACGKSSDRNR